LEPTGYAGLDVWDLAFRAAFDLPTQLLFAGGDAKQFSAHYEAIVILSIVSEIIYKAMNQMSWIMCDVSFPGNAEYNAVVEENERRSRIGIDFVTFNLTTVDCSSDFNVIPLLKFMFKRKR